MSLAALPVAASLAACHDKPTTSVDAIPLDGFTTAVLRQEDADELTLGKLSSFLETSCDDSDALAAMFSGLGADGTLALTEAVGDHVGLTHRASDAESELARKTLGQLKRSLGAASKKWELGYARRFGADLVEAAAYPDPASLYYQLGNRNESLAYLLYDASGANDELILGAADKMDRIQRQAAAAGYPHDWAWNGRPRFLPGMVEEADEDWAHDIPTIIMHDLGAHGRASYKFFTGDDGRVEYWVGEHVYDGDLSGIAAALDSASTTTDFMTIDRQACANVAAFGIEAMARRKDFGVKRVKHGKRGVEGAQSLEHILEAYMDSLIVSYATGGWEYPGTYTLTTATGQKIPNSPWFNRMSLDVILGVIGRDGRAMIHLRTAVNNAELNSLPPGSDEEDLTIFADYWAEVEGGTTNAIGTGGIRGAANPDYRFAQAWTDLANKPASELAELAQQCVSDAFDNAAVCDSSTLIDLLKDDTSLWRNGDDNTDEKRRAIRNAAYSSYMRRMLWAADAAGLNGYQDPDSGHTLDSYSTATVQDPDGTYRLITPQEYEHLSDEEKKRANTELEMLADTPGCMGDAVGEVKNSFDQQFQERYP
ncbi:MULTISPECIES: hypothetical protein [unclassified Actinomyces]|uniref:hypothetical protein n=1 Tax=unclassified Actinomyces TaxID=2609248 RepID=UPI000D58E226|nr:MULTISPECIES: hypothetical protein [unclassified Actinomyces]RAX20655.1 hypothetical protein DRB07_13230 [Actinomyces sp. Z3]